MAVASLGLSKRLALSGDRKEQLGLKESGWQFGLVLVLRVWVEGDLWIASGNPGSRSNAADPAFVGSLLVGRELGTTFSGATKCSEATRWWGKGDKERAVNTRMRE